MNGKICVTKKFLLLAFLLFLLGMGVIFFSNLLIKKTTTVKTRAEEIKSQNSIMYGVPAEENEFPYFTLILIKRTEGIGLCGGSLIGEEWVLTAAHCLVKSKPEDLLVIIGLNRADSQLIAQNYSTVKEIIPRIDFNDDEPIFKISNDIALLHLANKASGVPIISIPNPDPNGDEKIDPDDFPENKYSDVRTTIIGFGINESKVVSQILLKGHPKIEKLTGITDKIYLPSPGGGVVACGGDSGGPLIMMIDGKPHVIGVAKLSGIKEDGTCVGYSLYTSVSRYSKWIKDVTNIPYASGLLNMFGPPFLYPPQTLQKLFCNETIEYKGCSLKFLFCNWYNSCQRCTQKELSEEEACK